jgi:hypothetical protein
LKQVLENVKKIVLHSWINVLLVFVPVGIASHIAHLNPNIGFFMDAIAVIPLAGLLTYATESVAHRLGDTLGALLNVSFGNAVELIILYVCGFSVLARPIANFWQHVSSQSCPNPLMETDHQVLTFEELLWSRMRSASFRHPY